MLCGIGGAVVGAATWYTIVVFTDRQFGYVAVGLGLAVGYEADGGQYFFSGLCVAAAAFFGFDGIHTSRGYTGNQVPR